MPMPGLLILISFILLFRSISLVFIFEPIPILRSGSSVFFVFPSIFTSPLILGIFISFFPGIIPENIKVSSFSLILISPVLIFGIFALILGPLIFAFALGISTFPFKSIFPVLISNLGSLIFFPGISPFNSKLGPLNLAPSKFIFAEGIFTSKSVPIFCPLISNFGLLMSKLPFPGISPVILVSGKLAFIFKSFPPSLSFFPKIIPVIFSYFWGLLIFISLLMSVFNFISGTLIFPFKSKLASNLFFKSAFGISPFNSIFFEPFSSMSSKSILFFNPGNFVSISPPIFPFNFNSGFGILPSKLRLLSFPFIFKSGFVIPIFDL